MENTAKQDEAKAQHRPWIAGHAAQKQSNYGKYKAGLHRGEGKAFESVTITADTPELALEMARRAACYDELAELAKLFLRSIDYQIKKDCADGDVEGANLKAFTRNQIVAALAKAEAA